MNKAEILEYINGAYALVEQHADDKIAEDESFRAFRNALMVGGLKGVLEVVGDHVERSLVDK